MAGTISGPADTVDSKFNELHRIVMGMVTARPLEATTISKGGIQVRDAGSISVYNPDDTATVAYVGAFDAAYNRPDGKPQMGVEIRRDTGELAFSVFDSAPLVGPYQQFVAMWDRATPANVIVSDDTNGGKGLARPHLPMSTLQPMTLSLWPTTTSATMAGLLAGYQERQSPGIAFSLWLHADAATTGVFQLSVDGSVVATSPSVTNSFVVWSGSYYWPAGWTFGSTAAIEVDGQRTAGAGTISAQTLLLEGIQSP